MGNNYSNQLFLLSIGTLQDIFKIRSNEDMTTAKFILVNHLSEYHNGSTATGGLWALGSEDGKK